MRQIWRVLFCDGHWSPTGECAKSNIVLLLVFRQLRQLWTDVFFSVPRLLRTLLRMTQVREASLYLVKRALWRAQVLWQTQIFYAALFCSPSASRVAVTFRTPSFPIVLYSPFISSFASDLEQPTVFVAPFLSIHLTP